MRTAMTTTTTTTTEPPPWWRDPAWRRSLLRDAFGGAFWAFLALAVALGAACLILKGPAVTLATIEADLVALARTLPRVVVALAVASLIWVMLPKDRLSRHVGEDSGLRGLMIATLAGAITPGGPTSAYALLALLAGSGADRGALVAYITAWSTLALQRMLIWDVPFMGAEFAILRMLVSLPLPILAGLIARRLPFELKARAR